MLIVQKYGGSSVANTERIKNVANRIAATYKNGNSVVVVLSAQGDTTDDLIEKAKDITNEPSRRELDMLLSTGEQQSVALMAMALNSMGLPALSLNAQQVGVYTTSRHGNARIHKIEVDRINNELEKKNIVLVAGFQGYNKYDDITTLGRGGSDTTAVALASVLGADMCEIYTDVEGIYSADPRIVKTARKLNEITYDEMLELSSLGARVLHNRSVELAKKYNVELVVRSSLTNAEGTKVKEEVMEKMMITGVAVDKDVSRVSLIGIKDEPGMAFRIFSILAKNKVCVDIILQSVGRDGTKDISFTIAKADLTDTINLLENNKKLIRFSSIETDDKVAKVSIVGAGMASNSGVASAMFEALYDAAINISMISTSEIKISVLIDEKDADKALTQVHDKFSI